MKDTLGFIKEQLLNFYDMSDENTQQDFSIDENNIIDVKAIDDNNYNQSSQQTQNEEDFDYTLLKVIVFLIFL